MTRTPRALAAVLALSLVVALAACGKDKEPKVLSGLALTPAPAVGELSLPDASQDDGDFHFTATEGTFLVVYFGYTQCPDVCPTTLSEVKKAFKLLGDRSKDVDVAMITVDPTRDAGDLLTRYVQSFIPGAHALRTDDDAALKAVAKGFGAVYDVKFKDDGTEEVTHSGNLYVVDPTGTVVLEWPFGLQAKAISTDLEILFSGV